MCEYVRACVNMCVDVTVAVGGAVVGVAVAVAVAVGVAVAVAGGWWWWWCVCVCVCVFDHGLYWGFWAWVSLLVAFFSCLFLCGGVCVRVRMCVFRV